MKSKLFILMFCIIFLVGPVSAADFDNRKSFDESIGDYGKIVIKDWFGLKDLADLELKENTDSCGENCYAIKEINLYQDGALIDDVKFETIRDDGNRLEQPIREYNFYIQTGVTEKVIEDYGLVITGKNISGGDILESKLIGSHIEELPIWIPYNLGEIKPVGIYNIKLEGQKKPSRTVDWIIKSQGKWIDEWAIWGEDVYFRSSYSNTSSGTNSQTEWIGEKITMNISSDLVNVTTLSRTTANLMRVFNGSLFELINTSITSNLATFPNLTLEAGKEYYFVVQNADESTYTHDQAQTITNREDERLTFTCPVIEAGAGACQSAGSSNVHDILTITTLVHQTGIDLNAPKDNFKSGSATINFNCTATPGSGVTLQNISLWHNGTGTFERIKTNSTFNNLNTTTFTSIFGGDGNYFWTCSATDSDNDEAFATFNRTLTIDTTPPSINILSPNETFTFNLVGDNLTLNWTVTDLNLESCWFTYDNTNTTVTCNSNNFSFITTTQKDLTFFANDSGGNEGSSLNSWNYKLLEINQSFSNLTLEGATENFFINVQISSPLQLSTANLIYNNSAHTGSFKIVGEDYSIQRSLIIPDVPTESNVSFFWSFLLSDGTLINTSEKNQTVKILDLDNCTSFSNQIFNLTIVDEKEQNILTNTTLETDIILNSQDQSLNLGNFSFTSTENPTSFCINENLTASTNYSITAIFKYEALDHEIEYYNIINNTISLNDSFSDITLYDLNTSQSTEFRITFQDSSFQAVAGALVFIDRQYVSEGVFKTVELPVTDSNGETLGHFVRNDINYNILVVKNGEVIGDFRNIRVFCDDFTIGKCLLGLDATSGLSIDYDFDEELGLLFSMLPNYNNNTDLVTFTFSSVSGDAEEVTLSVERNDAFGNRTLCNDTLTSSSGTLSCTAGIKLSDTLLITKVLVNGEEKITEFIEVNQTDLGSIGYLIWFVLTLFLLFGFGDIKEMVYVALIISYVGAVALGLTERSLFGFGASGIWIIGITFLGLYKINAEK